MSAPTHTGHLVDADLGAVARVLDDYFARQIDRAARYGEPYLRLWEVIRDTAAGGKRFRPALLLLTYRHLAEHHGPLPREVTELAAALELLHASFVIHDDVIDHDLVRRGRPNVAGHAVVDAIDAGARTDAAASYGQASAILAGDLLLSAAHTLVAGLPAAPEHRHALLALLEECVIRTAAGEHADVWAAVASSPDEAGVITVVENKTAVYSFSVPLRAGGILAGADARTLAGLDRAGAHLGVAFQLRDDVLGVFGDEPTTGKSATGDLREGKETLLVAYARADHRWRQVADRFGRPDLDEESAERIRRVIRDSGALAKVETRIVLELGLARATLRELGAPPALQEVLVAVTEQPGGRRR